MHRGRQISGGLIVAAALLSAFPARAVTVPGPADPGRIGQPMQGMSTPKSPTAKAAAATAPQVVAPKGAEKVYLTLRSVEMKGATVFTPEELAALYTDRLDQKITLADVYAVANALSVKYSDAGYFLTRVSVPDQRVDDGAVVIAVTEGYISDITLDDARASHPVIEGHLNRIRAARPIKMQTLEAALLSLNDLPGQSFRAVLSAAPSGLPGESMLTLIPQEKKANASLEFDNYGSRFLGPSQLTLTASDSLLPLQQTTVYGLAATTPDELMYGMVRHELPLAPDVTLQAELGLTEAEPGYTLAPLQIESRSTNAKMNLKYQWLRQRGENLSTGIALEGRNVKSNLFGTALTREQVRVLRANIGYDITDAWRGTNVINFTLSQSLRGLGASKAGELNLTRGQAKPGFAKGELTVSRLQGITQDWSALIQVSGQKASGPLYSSEEFGYGGQAFGRAYDVSEVVGDEGAAGALELRYGGWRALQPINLEPYAFYDMGIVTNKDTSQSARTTASSAGAGVRFATGKGQAGNLGIAIPLTREVLTPIYGANPASPRIMLQISQGF